MRILIAEDNPLIRQHHRHLMDSWGFDYDLAENGAEAVELRHLPQCGHAPDVEDPDTVCEMVDKMRVQA